MKNSKFRIEIYAHALTNETEFTVGLFWDLPFNASIKKSFHIRAEGLTGRS